MQSRVISLVGTIALIVSFLRTRPPGAPFPPRDAIGRTQFLHTARSITATSWPLVLSSFAPNNGGACVWPSVVWMFLVWWLDVRHLTAKNENNENNKSGTTTGLEFLQRAVRIEPSVITALTFGLCGLAGARSDTQYTRYILYAFVACILIVLPRVELSVEDHMSPIISEVQRMVLIHGIATMVTCVCLTRTSTRQVQS